MRFIEQLDNAITRNASLICVGLDPDPVRFPQVIGQSHAHIFEFNRAIIDATHDQVCAYKPQIAYYAAHSAEAALLQTVEYIHQNYPEIPVILDAKRSDIGSTARQYAVEAFERYGADAVTINPYLGRDSAQPFLDYADRGVICLCRTSNPGAADFQDLMVDGEPLYQVVARQIAETWNANGNCLLVVGATWPEQMKALRQQVGAMPFLVPGVGAQGGDAEAIVKAGQTADGRGLVISTSRAVLYASDQADFAQAARAVASELRETVNRHRC